MTSIIEKPFIQKVKVKKKSTKLKTIVTARLASYQQLFNIFFFFINFYEYVKSFGTR